LIDVTLHFAGVVRTKSSSTHPDSSRENTSVGSWDEGPLAGTSYVRVTRSSGWHVFVKRRSRIRNVVDSRLNALATSSPQTGKEAPCAAFANKYASSMLSIGVSRDAISSVLTQVLTLSASVVTR
jgi:hypothetical protein